MIKHDYSVFRLLKMMFRLNFLVIIVMAVTNHEFVRYYVCAMHTYWFLSVWAMLVVLNRYNKVRNKLICPGQEWPSLVQKCCLLTVPITDKNTIFILHDIFIFIFVEIHSRNNISSLFTTDFLLFILYRLHSP